MGNSNTTYDSRKISVFFKGIAILMVILVHSHQFFSLSAPQNAIQRFCQMGCQIFFVLSSFGLCYSFSKKVPRWHLYMKNRISKLAIGYYGAIVLHIIYRIVVATLTNQNILSAINIPGIILNAFFLHGLVPIHEINNTMVRGGWYIGTTIILYALFPLIYKIYFSTKNKTWEKYRAIFSPTILFAFASCAIIVSENIHPIFTCSNNSFVYFSFINQLTPFALGIVLFDIHRRYQCKKTALWLALFSLGASIFLFFGNFRFSFILCPSLVALSFMLLFWYIINNQILAAKFFHSSNVLVKCVCEFGKNSYSIYLTHAFIAYEFSSVCLKLLRPLYNCDLLWYIILLPIELFLIFTIGKIYNKCISFFESKKQKT